MQARTYYEDHELRVTESEIRCKALTIRTEAVTSVSIASARPLKWLPIFLLLPVILIVLILLVVARLGGGSGAATFLVPIVAITPLVAIAVAASLVRISRLYLQTSGGPVVLALKFEFSEPTKTLYRFESIKQAIEQAMHAAKS